MDKISKAFALFLTIVLAMSCLTLLTVELANAQTSPTPSVPTYVLRYVDGSYDVPTTQTIDPYTGETITHQGHRVNQTNFEMVIQNQLQPIDNLYYSIRIKGHYATDWISFYDLSEGLPHQDSSSHQTILRLGILSQDGLTLQGAHKSITIPFGGKEDIQVQALIGSIGRDGSQPMVPYVFYGTESDWSPTQTITVPASTDALTPSPSVPELSWLVIVPLLLSVFFVALVIRRQKRQPEIQPH